MKLHSLNTHKHAAETVQKRIDGQKTSIHLADWRSCGGIVGNVAPLAVAEGSQSERSTFAQLLTAATLLHSRVAAPDNTPT